MSCPYHNITSVGPPCRAGFAANIKNYTEPASDVDAMGIKHDMVLLQMIQAQITSFKISSFHKVYPAGSQYR